MALFCSSLAGYFFNCRKQIILPELKLVKSQQAQEKNYSAVLPM
jgi:hypothetical protein